MSETPAPRDGSFALKLDIFQAGELRRPAKNHVHIKTVPYSILLQTMEGYYRVECRGACFDLLPKQVALIPANTQVKFVHKSKSGGIIHSHWIHFFFSYLGIVDYLSLFQTPLRFPANSETAIQRLIKETLAVQKGCDPMKISFAYSLSAKLLQMVCEHATSNAAAWKKMETQKLQAVIQYIHRHLSDALEVTELAKLAGLSSSRFHHCFVQEFATTPMRYVSEARLAAAARMLVGCGFKLERIAELCGFSDAFHLSHAFKRRYGVPPKNFRLQIP